MAADKVRYDTRETSLGTWRRYVYPTGGRFAEFRSRSLVHGYPLIHYTYGLCPETGKRITAKGILAVGRFAVGVVAIGQVAVGLIALGQAAIGILLGLGQGATGLYCVGQLAVGIAFGLGQVATGHVAIGQIGIGTYVLAQAALGRHVWSPSHVDPAARELFRSLYERLVLLLQIA